MYLNEYFNFEKLMNDLRTFSKDTFLNKVPTKFPTLTGDHSVEKGTDNDGKWEKHSYKSNNGLVSVTYYTKTYTPETGYPENWTPKGWDKSTTWTWDKPKNEKPSKTTDYAWELKNKLQDAIDTQDFESAVTLRDEIRKYENNYSKITKLEEELAETIKSQDFEKSIELRDKINKLKSK